MSDDTPAPRPLPAILTRVCAECSVPNAPFGFRDPLRDADPGRWFCSKHREVGEAEHRKRFGA